MTATPNLSAVLAWVNGDDLSAPIEWPAPDPYRHLSTAARIAYAIRACSSGAPAFSDVRQVVEHVPSGRKLPPPPPKESS